MYKRSLLVALILASLIAAAYARPDKVVSLVGGVRCTGQTVCTDDPSRDAQAQGLYDEALRFVGERVAPLDRKPVVVFCSTDACYRSFGLTDASAKTLGHFAIVIGPRAWKPYYVRHEMIHEVQAERLGVLRMAREPMWFVEGMAYALSDDPRPQLAEPFQGYRAHFDSWAAGIDKSHFWQAASDL